MYKNLIIYTTDNYKDDYIKGMKWIKLKWIPIQKLNNNM